jgi:hypothetical protein
VVWRVLHSPEGQQALEGAQRMGQLAKKGGELLDQAVDAPGAAELEAAGCGEAMVLDLNSLAGAVKDALELDAGDDDEPEGPPDDDEEDGGLDPFAGALVTCDVKDGGAPSCDALAQVYARAARPTLPFTMSVTSGDAGCTAQYDVSGTRVSP